MTSRFIQSSYDNADFADVLEHLHSPVISLEQALQPFSNHTDGLYHDIRKARENIRSSTGHGLTTDEAVALNLYAENRQEKSLYYLLNAALQSRRISQVKPWFEYLKILRNGLAKLPAVRERVWRGMDIELAKNLQVKQELVWWTVSSCSSAYGLISFLLNKNVILCSIDSLTGKNVCRYTGRIDQLEVLFLPGTRLRVKSKDYNPISHELVIHLVEIVTDAPARTIPMVTSSASSKKLSGIAETPDSVFSVREKSIDIFSIREFRTAIHFIKEYEIRELLVK